MSATAATGLVIDSPLVSNRIFFPRKTPRGQVRDLVAYTTANGDHIELACHYEPAPLTMFEKLSRVLIGNRCKTVVFFHGNGELVGDYVGGKFANVLLNELKVNVFFVEYRGYGSSTGEPQLVQMFEDLAPIHDYLTKKLGLRTEDLTVHGRSLGSLYATEFARRYPAVHGLIIECGFGNPADVVLRRLKADAAIAEEVTPQITQITQEIAAHMDNTLKLTQLPPHIRVLVFHARDDNVIPHTHAQTNYEARTRMSVPASPPTEQIPYSPPHAPYLTRLVVYPLGQHNFFRSANENSYEVEGVKYSSMYEEMGVFINGGAYTISVYPWGTG